MNDLPESFRDLRMTNMSNLVTTHDRCFYVPLYQRDFSWKKEDRQRFREDIQMGLSSFVKSGGSGDKESLTFLGSMISYRDTDENIKLGGNGDWHVPSADLCAVIDGQQRLTMFMLMSVALHDYIRTRQGGGEEWLQMKAEEMLKSTAKIFQIESDLGGNHHYFPRMIRQDCDVWSRKEGKALYASPLSHYVHAYGEFSRKPANSGETCHKQIRPHKFPSDPEREIQSKNFVRLADEIVEDIALTCSGWQDIPDIREILKNKDAMRALQIRELPDDCVKTLKTEKQLELARAVVLSAYALRRVFFVATETTNEGLAFDIFESLNTTGQPLTAYETFKPDVIQFENAQKGYKDSLSAEYLGEIDGILRTVTNSPRKESLTSEILVAFALSETGDKLSRKIRDQRTYLRSEFGAPDLSVDDKRGFSGRMMEAAVWLATEKSDKKWTLRRLLEEVIGSDGGVVPEEEVEGADFCLDFINAASHKISRGVFLRFYHAAKHAPAEEKMQKCIELLRAIKATAAFFALFRGIGGRSSRVERCHRGIMGGVEEFPADKFPELPFCHSGKKAPNLQVLQRAFGYYLNAKGGVKCADDWVKKSAEIPLYEDEKDVAKFLVMVASNNTDMDDDAPGCIKPVNPGVHPRIIASGSWKKEDHETVEHIVPQSKASQLGVGNPHCLGNLTLLSKRANSILGADEWEKRQPIYFALSAKTPAETEKAKKATAFLGKGEQVYLLQKRYLPMTRTLAFCEEFTNSEVESRHRNLAKLAWETLAEDWLGFAE